MLTLRNGFDPDKHIPNNFEFEIRESITTTGIRDSVRITSIHILILEGYQLPQAPIQLLDPMF